MTSETAAEARPLGPRARARAEMTERILDAAHRQMATSGAAGLSLRAVAREVGVVSSAVHRYFPTRDDLLTALLIDTYDSLGDIAEAEVAGSRNRAPRRRWIDAARAIRAWALERPHGWALLYGTPVPGYAAPDLTVAPGVRVTLALVSIVADAAADGLLEPPDDPAPIPGGVVADLRAVAQSVEVPVEPPVLLRTIAAWTQLFGLVGFELFGQTRNLVDDDEALFVAATDTMARVIGLSGASR